ncbi:MAG TPA: tetratricopeptide repeat protein [Candidatus Polarisedimenticolia bacterium]|nr:tetratricopeptide repeat protein [Candidatus Polarisedimenticolia bacterium]
MLQGKIDAAIAQYEILVKDNPRDVNTINKIGDLYSRLGKKKDAIHQFSKIGEQYTKDGFFLKAIAIYKKIVKLDPASVDSLQRMADLHARQGLVNEARSQYQLLIERLLKAGDVKRAIVAQQALVRLDPADARLGAAMADLLAQDGRPSEAADEYLRLGAELERAGHVKDARELYKKASALHPSSPTASIRVAGALAAEGDLEGAIRILREATAKPGDHGEILLSLARFQLQAGRHSESQSAARQALEQKPPRLEARILLAEIELSRGDATAAFEAVGSHIETILKLGKGSDLVALLEQVTGLDDSHLGAWRGLADVHSALKSDASAITCRERLLHLCIEQGNLSEARTLAEMLVKQRPGDASLRERLELVKSAEARAVAGARQAAPEPYQTQQAGMGAGYLGGPAEEDLSVQTSEDAWSDGGTTTATAPSDSAVPSGSSDRVSAMLGLAPPPRIDPEDEDFIAEHMTEADVFVKYGLGERAIEQLLTVTQRFPGYVPAHEKLKEIFLEEGDRERACEQMILLVKAHLAAGDRRVADEALADLMRFDPESRDASAIAEALRAADGGPDQSAQPNRAKATSPVAGATAAPARAPAPEEDASGPSSADLQSVDALLASKRRDDAVQALRGLAEKFGSHPDLVARMRHAMTLPPQQAAPHIAATAATAATSDESAPDASAIDEEEFEISMEEAAADEVELTEIPPEEPDTVSEAPHQAPADLLDLAAEIDAALSGESSQAETLAESVEATPEGHSLEEIVRAFKKGIEDQVGAEDFDTHYNLGIAYKEMGLLDEAIGEFQFASKEPRLLLDTCSMLGVCFREKGMGALAIKWYRRGVDATSTADEETALGLRYDLAELLAASGESREAMDLFTEVYGVNSKFRDVAGKIRELEQILSRS